MCVWLCARSGARSMTVGRVPFSHCRVGRVGIRVCTSTLGSTDRHALARNEPSLAKPPVALSPRQNACALHTRLANDHWAHARRLDERHLREGAVGRIHAVLDHALRVLVAHDHSFIVVEKLPSAHTRGGHALAEGEPALLLVHAEDDECAIGAARRVDNMTQRAGAADADMRQSRVMRAQAFLFP